MTLKRKIWNFYVQLIRKRFCAIKSNHNYLPGKAPLCLVTIAFNSDFLIKEQIRLVKKHITDSHIHIVADNSSDNKKRKAIKALCEKENITYVNLPFNWFNRIDRRGSYSHGLAMAWVYCNIIKKVKPDVFGFIDHDIFPIKPYSLLQKIGNQDFYGRLIDRTPEHYPPPPQIWYLWAGFCFFNYDKVKDLKLNFMPCKVDGHYLDTAGGNYYPLYSKYNFEEIKFTSPVVEKYFREGNVYHSDLLHFIDANWVHTINGSNWKKVKTKDDFLKQYLKQY